MPLDKFKEMIPRKDSKPRDDDYFEITEEHVQSDGKLSVKIETLGSYEDTEKVQGLLRDGNIVFLRIKDLRAKDIAELKKSVDKLRKTCMAMDGDMVGVEEDFLVITPQFAQIYRGRTS